MMRLPSTLEEIAVSIETGNNVLFFTADWCGDCRYIYPMMPEIEAEFSQYRFIQIDRDQFLPLCQKWGIMGIPSFIVTSEGKEIGRYVNKERKTKAQIVEFLNSI